LFDTPITTSDHSIDRVLNAGLPVLLVFLNGPAPQPLEDAMHQIARQNEGKLLVVKVQIKENPGSAARFQVSTGPAVAAVRDGKEHSRADGISERDLEQHAAYLLGRGPKPVERTGPATSQPAPEPHSSSAGYQPGSQAWNRASNPGSPVNVTDASFDRDVLGSTLPVLVDFWAPWCGPCRITEPILENLAREKTGRLLIAKVNVDENPLVAQRYGVQSIPTMMVVKNGQVIDRWVGALPEASLRSRLSVLKL
jgi:thioredoxin 1